MIPTTTQTLFVLQTVSRIERYVILENGLLKIEPFNIRGLEQ